MSELKSKLSEVEDDLRGLREDLATAKKKREESKAAYANVPEGEDDKPYFDAALEDSRVVGEIEENILAMTEKRGDVLKIIGDKEEQSRNGGRTPSRERLEESAGWDSSKLFTEELVQQLGFIAGSRSKFGTIEFGSLVDRDVLMADIAEGLTTTQRKGTYRGVIPAIRRPFSFLDLIPTGTTDGNTVPYTRESAITGGALEVAEGDTKPEQYFDYDDDEAPVRTIAAYMKVRKQALADVAGLQSIMDGRLRYLVNKRLEAQVLNGNGSGVNLKGILQDDIGSIEANADIPLTEQILSGITAIYLNDGAADGIVLHPTDWQTALTEKAHYGGGAGASGTEGSYEYQGGGPFGSTPTTVWGVPITPSQVMTAKTGLVADFSVGATLLIRDGLKVLMSDSDQDDFIRNRVTMLAEMRAALLIWRPALFQELAF